MSGNLNVDAFDSQDGPSTRCVWAAATEPAFDGTMSFPQSRGVTNAAKTYEELVSRATYDPANEPHSNSNIHGYGRNTSFNKQAVRNQMMIVEDADPGKYACFDFASGMAAIYTAFAALTVPGDTIVSIRDTYGGTASLLTKTFPAEGRRCILVPTEEEDQIATEVRERKPKMLYIETPTNPTLKVLDISRLAAICHDTGTILVVDNTFATPINQRPLTHGANLVVYSATKYINGHGDAMGGFAIGDRALVRKMYDLREIIGNGLSNADCEIIPKGIKTLALRVSRHNENARRLAELCLSHPVVTNVYYPGLITHPSHAVAKKQMIRGAGFGGMFSICLEGGADTMKAFLNSLEFAALAPSLGHVETLVGPPSATSHVELTEAERADLGIPETLIRVSPGIEDGEDLERVFRIALDNAQRALSSALRYLMSGIEWG